MHRFVPFALLLAALGSACSGSAAGPALLDASVDASIDAATPPADSAAPADAAPPDGAAPTDAAPPDGAAPADGAPPDGAAPADAAPPVDSGPGSPDGGCPAPGSPITVPLVAADDALASYLMSAAPPAWNIFSGAQVPLGRHFDGDHVSYHTALRFASVCIPPGATVTAARLSFYPTNEVDSSNNLWLNVYAERAADSAAFDPTSYDVGRPDQRLRTTAHIEKMLVRCNASCTDLTEWDCPQRKLDCWDRTVAVTVSKDLRTLVQEVVDQPGWAAGHALTLLLVNAATDADGAAYRSSRSVTGLDPARGAAYAPRLVVELAP